MQQSTLQKPDHHNCGGGCCFAKHAAIAIQYICNCSKDAGKSHVSCAQVPECFPIPGKQILAKMNTLVVKTTAVAEQLSHVACFLCLWHSIRVGVLLVNKHCTFKSFIHWHSDKFGVVAEVPQVGHFVPPPRQQCPSV